jgi:hypothetical protein
MYLVINDPGKYKFAAGIDAGFYFPRKGIILSKNRMYFSLMEEEVSVKNPAFIYDPGIFYQSIEHNTALCSLKTMRLFDTF